MELKFDKMDIDTTLAQNYKKQVNILVISQSVETYYFDGKNFSMSHNFILDKEYTEISHNLEKLAILLKDNVNLFAQLEYVNRKIPIDDTRAQLNLIIQQIYYLSSCNVDNIPITYSNAIQVLNYSHFLMYQETPIFNLGFVVRACVYLYHTQSIPCITAKKETAEVCYLFTSLCHDASLTVVTRFGDSTMEYHPGKEALGTVGVISETSDLDSAVDVFLTSSKQVKYKVPWRLRRILVQESVYKQFKEALTWKCNLNITGEAKSTQSTSDILHFNGREFLIDALDVSDPKPFEVTVEAYRTRKELLSLLNQYRPHYVSLWANDVAEINEIAHYIPSQVVWVNSFAEFRGPPRITNAIYSVIPPYCSYYEYLSKKEVFEVLELQKSWLKLDNQARYDVLSKVLKGLPKSVNDVYSVFRRAQVYSHGTFVNVGKDYVCQGVPVLTDKIHYCSTTTNILNESFFRSIYQGYVFFFKSGILDTESSLLINALKNAGLPVSAEGLLTDKEYYECRTCEVVFDFDLGTKVIWTNSGTIFAN